MWSKLQGLWQRTSSHFLVLTLFLSLLLHLVLLGQFNFNLEDLGAEQHVIKAQIVLPLPSEFKPPKSVAYPRAKRLILPKPAQSIQPVPDTPSVTQISPVSAVSEETIPSGAPEEIDQSQNEDEQIAINTNAYHYVDARYDVRTDVNAKFDDSSVGKASMEYQLLLDGTHYQSRSLIEPKGLVSLFIPNLLQTSDGLLTSSGLQPQHYLYQFGSKKNKTFSADFDWPNQKLILHSDSEIKQVDLPDGTQDLLSFIFQFMFVEPFHKMQISVTNGKKLGIYDYSFEGEEMVPTKMGNLNTFHILRLSAEGDEKTELWLALDYQHVPVKIRKTEKEGKVYELLISSLKTEKPARPTP